MNLPQFTAQVALCRSNRAYRSGVTAWKQEGDFISVLPALNRPFPRLVCPSGETLCSGGCAKTSSDPNNCRRCGNTCPTYAIPCGVTLNSGEFVATCFLGYEARPFGTGNLPDTYLPNDPVCQNGACVGNYYCTQLICEQTGKDEVVGFAVYASTLVQAQKVFAGCGTNCQKDLGLGKCHFAPGASVSQCCPSSKIFCGMSYALPNCTNAIADCELI